VWGGKLESRLSLDQVGVIAAGAGKGSDGHYAQLAAVATVSQLRTTVRLEPGPDPNFTGFITGAVSPSLAPPTTCRSPTATAGP